MSTVGHLFVGAAASRYALRSKADARRIVFAVLLTGAAIAPDLDLSLLPALGIPESVTLGHRGATHSLVVALAVTLVVALLARAFRLPVRRVTIGGALAIGSHALLDSLSPGPGVAWLWPFIDTRLPTLPILPIAPLDHLLSVRGLSMLLAEMVVFSPFLAYALFARPADGPGRADQRDEQPRSVV
ncbi:MAG TPA: metal-dependent hydrolase [Candidatus Limnocylindria bacterium]|jgi:inner membrane protein|nr:metal-dependent hydrolase [Candidatus Limnocylindria bacterium]